MTSLTDSVVVVTGANGGLGREFVRQALERGATKVYATARTPEGWNDPRIVPLALDVTSANSVAQAAAAAADATIVINNAGVPGTGRMSTMPLDEVRAVFETNVFGPLAVAQAFAPVLAANGGGALVDIHSLLSWLALGNAYSASKAAFWSITNSLRLELAGQGTQVLGVHLGYTDTPMTVNVTAPKGDPVDVVRDTFDALEAGAHEAVVDEPSRRVRAALSAPLEALYPSLAVGPTA